MSTTTRTTDARVPGAGPGTGRGAAPSVPAPATAQGGASP